MHNNREVFRQYADVRDRDALANMMGMTDNPHYNAQTVHVGTAFANDPYGAADVFHSNQDQLNLAGYQEVLPDFNGDPVRSSNLGALRTTDPNDWPQPMGDITNDSAIALLFAL